MIYVILSADNDQTIKSFVQHWAPQLARCLRDINTDQLDGAQVWEINMNPGYSAGPVDIYPPAHREIHQWGADLLAEAIQCA